MTTPDLAVLDVPDSNRYEARTPDGFLAGFAAYQIAGHLIVMAHTEVDPAYEGQGVGSRLVAGALDDVRRRGLPVLPLCPFRSRLPRAASGLPGLALPSFGQLSEGGPGGADCGRDPGLLRTRHTHSVPGLGGLRPCCTGPGEGRAVQP